MDWKRRFFVLDSQGLLYYYSQKVEGGRGAICVCFVFIQSNYFTSLHSTTLHYTTLHSALHHFSLHLCTPPPVHAPPGLADEPHDGGQPADASEHGRAADQHR